MRIAAATDTFRLSTSPPPWIAARIGIVTRRVAACCTSIGNPSASLPITITTGGPSQDKSTTDAMSAMEIESGASVAARLVTPRPPSTRKSLGGLHTDVQGRVLTPEGSVLPGLFAAGEVCGFGGGGYHGYNALEGTFLGGCLYSGRMAGQNA